MSWPEAVFYSIVALCATVAVLYIVERHYQSRDK